MCIPERTAIHCIVNGLGTRQGSQIQHEHCRWANFTFASRLVHHASWATCHAFSGMALRRPFANKLFCSGIVQHDDARKQQRYYARIVTGRFNSKWKFAIVGRTLYTSLLSSYDMVQVCVCVFVCDAIQTKNEENEMK